MGFEGANVLFDTWVHPLVMGLEEHLLTMFRDDFEFSDAAGASHLGHAPHPPSPSGEGPGVEQSPVEQQSVTQTESSPPPTPPLKGRGEEEGGWTDEALAELGKIPFFVRGKARRNTERYAAEHGVTTITRDTLYEAKSHYAR
jgi:light-independent protochlorophyllide reductase subunit B